MSESEIRLKITEIFHSIQGESTLAGERFTFVRVTGCPLRCTYCDTTYSYSGGKWMTVGEIIEAVKAHETKWVCLTGGEPLAHKNSLALVRRLVENGKSVTIETDGEENVENYVGLAKLIMDIKTPGSGETAKQCFINIEKLLPTDEIKFVICNKEDYLWAKDICEKYSLTNRFTVLFSPSWGLVNLALLAEWIVEDKLNVRLQTQLHKHIWGANTKGV